MVDAKLFGIGEIAFMKIALTVWEDRISPVFDVASTILVAEIQNGQVLNRQSMPFNPGASWQFTRLLRDMGVSALICGAISKVPATMISVSGIELIPFISGKTEMILVAYANGGPISQDFSMPGTGRQRRRMRKQPAYFTQQREVANMPGKDGTGPLGQGPRGGQRKGGRRQNVNRQAGDNNGGRGGQGRKGGRGQGQRKK
jgi:predicted Fe-Mo cluster-binding NifX family protein